MSDLKTLTGIYNVHLQNLGTIPLLISADYVVRQFGNGRSGCEVRNVRVEINNKWLVFRIPPAELIDDLCRDIYALKE
jgi:hypothetical protein